MPGTDRGLRTQASLGIAFKFISLFFSFLSVRLLVSVLGAERYGLWVTLASVFSWFTFLDFGVAASLQNNLTESYLNEDLSGKKLISTTFLFLLVVSVSVLFLSLLFFRFISPSFFLDTLGIEPAELRVLIFIMSFSASGTLLLKPVSSIFLSLKKSSSVHLIRLISMILTVFGLFLIRSIFPNVSIAVVAAVVCPVPVLVTASAAVPLFKTNIFLKPKGSLFDLRLLKKLLALGIQFFFIHLCWAVINTTDNIIISNQLGSAQVTVFDLTYKVLLAGKIVFFLLLTPLWPQLSEYYNDGKIADMKRLMKKYFFIMLLVDFVIIIAALFLNDIVRVWIGKDINIPPPLVFFTALFFIIDNAVGLFTYCLNAMSRIKLQSILYIAGASVNIPLSVFLVNTGLGNAGVIAASCICYIPLLVLMPLQTLLALREKV